MSLNKTYASNYQSSLKQNNINLAYSITTLHAYYNHYYYK